MPKIQTHLNFHDYKRFQEKARQLNITDYELAKEMVLYCLNDDIAKNQMKLTQKLKKLAQDLWQDNIP
jgi:hypothetical protein